MPCDPLLDANDNVIGIVCSAPWGMGTTDYGHDPDDPTEEYRYIYGFGGRGDPHNFEPSFEENTKKEIASWEAAKAACDNPDCPERKIDAKENND